MGLFLTMMIVVMGNMITGGLTFLILYRYNLLTGIDNSKDPAWLMNIRKPSRWK